MRTIVKGISHPEFIFGFVAPVGADMLPTVAKFRSMFESIGYHVVEIKVTDSFHTYKDIVQPAIALVDKPDYNRYKSYIGFGDQLREIFDDDGILAIETIFNIARQRLSLSTSIKETDYLSKTVYLVRQFKRPEEIELLRSVYGPLFFQVSIYSRRGARVDHLSRTFASSENSLRPQDFRQQAEEIILQDEHEVDISHGQQLAKIFHDADFIVNLDAPIHVEDQVERFFNLLFSSNSISPTLNEYGMSLARSAALKSLDLSRQVGAAIFSANREIISVGANEVPKAKGGTYWEDDFFDDRDYKRGYDSNERHKREIFNALLSDLMPNSNPNEIYRDRRIRESRFMDSLEYSRVVHAEMTAIMDAARLGRSLSGTTLFCTTFPCHICAKHIIASGIEKVVFLEPYPKSLAQELHSDALLVEGADRGRYQEYPMITFEHFYGVSPRRYQELFSRSKRKDSDGKFMSYASRKPTPIISIPFPFYSVIEADIIEELKKKRFHLIRN